MTQHSDGLSSFQSQTLVLTPWKGSWDNNDPDANFKEEVVAYGLLDPLETLNGLADSLDIPIGAIARYVLAKWATGGSEGMLHLGSSTVQRMHDTCRKAEEANTDDARLAAYSEVRQMIEWLHVPIEDPGVYGN
jgi:hypothetical protein